MAGPIKSTFITNAETGSATKSNPTYKNNVKQSLAYIGAGASDSAADGPYLLTRVHSSERVSSIKLDAPDFTTAGAIDVGFYWVPEDNLAAGSSTTVVAVTSGVEVVGGTAKGDVLADGYALTSGVAPFTQELLYAGGTNAVTKANSHKRVWEVLGLTKDPDKFFVIGVAVATTFNGGPTSDGLLFRIETVNG